MSPPRGSPIRCRAGETSYKYPLARSACLICLKDRPQRPLTTLLGPSLHPHLYVSGLATFEPALGRTIEFDTFRGGSVTFVNDDPIVIEHMTLTNNGVIRTPATITITDHLDWYAGTRFEGPGVVNIQNTMTLHPGGAQRSLTHRALNNAGLATFKSGLGLNYDDSVFTNLTTGTMDIQFDNTAINGGFLVNQGLLVKSSGAGITTLSSKIVNEGTMEVRQGTLRFYTYYSFHFAQVAGTTLLNGGNIDMFGPESFVVNGGVVTGQGSITGHVNCAGGTIAPGMDIGTLNVVGPLTLGAAGAVRIELQGADPGDFDVLEVTGTADLAGTLQVASLDAFDPRIGDTFVVLTAGSVVGEFDSVTGPKYMDVLYDDQTVTLAFLAPGDVDRDGDTDLRDNAAFQACFTGHAGPPSPHCPPGIDADLDKDGDVDLDDYATGAQLPVSGPR